MDTISFALQHSNVEDYLTTSILVNGLELKDILAQIEVNQIKDKSDNFIVGAYEGISPFIAFHSHNHFLKNTINEYIYFGNRFSLLEYINTGIPGEHTVACQIEILKETVHWKNFKNFSIYLKEEFSYGDLVFEFDRNQYESAIERLSENEIKKLYV